MRFITGILCAAALTGCSQSASESMAQARTLGSEFVPPAAAVVGPLPGEHVDSPAEPANPVRDDADAALDGRRLFLNFNCAGCHGDHGGGGMGPSLRDHIWRYGATDARIANSIAAGRADGMPAWGPKLTDVQIWQLTTYIKSMRTRSEPEPPRP